MSDTNTKSFTKKQIIFISLAGSLLFGVSVAILLFGDNCTASQPSLEACADQLRMENEVNSLWIDIYGKQWQILELEKLDDVFPTEQ